MTVSTGAAGDVLDPKVKRWKKAIDIFLRDAPVSVQLMNSAASIADEKALHQEAHKLKGGCSAIGAPRMAAICGELEHGLLADAATRLIGLAQELAAVCAELEAELVAKQSGGSLR